MTARCVKRGKRGPATAVLREEDLNLNLNLSSLSGDLTGDDLKHNMELTLLRLC